MTCLQVCLSAWWYVCRFVSLRRRCKKKRDSPEFPWPFGPVLWSGERNMWRRITTPFRSLAVYLGCLVHLFRDFSPSYSEGLASGIPHGYGKERVCRRCSDFKKNDVVKKIKPSFKSPEIGGINHQTWGGWIFVLTTLHAICLYFLGFCSLPCPMTRNHSTLGMAGPRKMMVCKWRPAELEQHRSTRVDLSMCVCVCMYVYMYGCMYVCMYVYIYIIIYLFIYLSIYIFHTDIPIMYYNVLN